MMAEEYPVGRAATSAALAANNSNVGAAPGENSILRIRHMIITNEAAATRSYTYHIGRIDTFLAGIASQGSAAFAELAGRRYYPDASGSQSNSMIYFGTRAGTFGATIGKVAVPPGSSLIIEFPEPGLVLFGGRSAGPGGIVVQNTTVNDPCLVGFYGLESPWDANTPVTSP